MVRTLIGHPINRFRCDWSSCFALSTVIGQTCSACDLLSARTDKVGETTTPRGSARSYLKSLGLFLTRTLLTEFS